MLTRLAQSYDTYMLDSSSDAKAMEKQAKIEDILKNFAKKFQITKQRWNSHSVQKTLVLTKSAMRS